MYYLFIPNRHCSSMQHNIILSIAMFTIEWEAHWPNGRTGPWIGWSVVKLWLRSSLKYFSSIMTISLLAGNPATDLHLI